MSTHLIQRPSRRAPPSVTNARARRILAARIRVPGSDPWPTQRRPAGQDDNAGDKVGVSPRDIHDPMDKP